MKKKKIEIREENKGIYELNTRFAAALQLKHQKKLDCEDHFYTFGGTTTYWDQRSVNVQLHNKSRTIEVDFTRSHDILLAYSRCLGMDLLLSREKPTVVVYYDNEKEEITADTVSSALMEAIMFYCEKMDGKSIGCLIEDFRKKL